MKKILVTGGTGQVGKELQQIMPDAIYLSSKDCDLTKESEVLSLMTNNKFDTIIHLAAKVGGIMDNINRPSEYLEDNLMMNTNLLKWSRITGVKQFVGILSTCIYPDKVETYPMTEEMLHQGPPTPTNFSYGYAKRCLAVSIDSMNKQYGTAYSYITPCNLYGVYDKFDARAHFLAHLIKKIHIAKTEGKNWIELYGTGTPLRQFMNAKDLAKVIKEIIDRNVTETFNVATPESLTIEQIAREALDALGCSDFTIIYDSTKPDGQYRKDVSIDKFKTIFPDYEFINLKDGIKEVYEKNFTR